MIPRPISERVIISFEMKDVDVPSPLTDKDGTGRDISVCNAEWSNVIAIDMAVEVANEVAKGWVPRDR